QHIGRRLAARYLQVTAGVLGYMDNVVLGIYNDRWRSVKLQQLLMKCGVRQPLEGLDFLTSQVGAAEPELLIETWSNGFRCGDRMPNAGRPALIDAALFV